MWQYKSNVQIIHLLRTSKKCSSVCMSPALERERIMGHPVYSVLLGPVFNQSTNTTHSRIGYTKNRMKQSRTPLANFRIIIKLSFDLFVYIYIYNQHFGTKPLGFLNLIIRKQTLASPNKVIKWIASAEMFKRLCVTTCPFMKLWQTNGPTD